MGLSLIYKFNTVSSTESLECINEMAIFLSQPLRYDSSALTRIVLDFGENVYPCHSYAVILYALKRLCVERKISLTFRLPSRSKTAISFSSSAIRGSIPFWKTKRKIG